MSFALCRIFQTEQRRIIVVAEQFPKPRPAHHRADGLVALDEADAGRKVFAYGAASRAVALFSRAGVDSRLLAAVADASPAKQGRRMPGTDIPIVSPGALLKAMPHRVLLTLPDLLPEVSARYPQLDGRWKLAGP